MESVAYIPASWRVYWIKPLLFFLLILLTQSACPNNPDPLECGENQIEVNGACDCVEGYHWNEDQTKCSMDTTSHDFVWEIDTLGDYGSYLNDVAIIDENNFWVVGNIETDTGTYNIAKWNGSNWNMNQIERPVDFDGVFAFSEDNIWLTDGCYVYFYNGDVFNKLWECNWQEYGPNQITDIWGSSFNDIYFVGNNGSIVHYDGSSFTKMESGLNVHLIDVEGILDGEYVFVAGYDYFLPTQTAALLINDGVVETLYYSENLVPQDDQDYGAVSGVSVWGDTAYFVTYQGFWKYNFETGTSNIDDVFENYDYNPIIVQNPNDILLIGGGFKYVHYNGSTWDFNDDLYNQYSFSDYGADFKGDMAVIVGMVRGGSHAIVGIGRR